MANNSVRSKAGMKAAKKSNATPAQKDNAKLLKSSVKTAKKVGKDAGFAGAKSAQGKGVGEKKSSYAAGNNVVKAKEGFNRVGDTASAKKVDNARTGAAQKVQNKLDSKGK